MPNPRLSYLLYGLLDIPERWRQELELRVALRRNPQPTRRDSAPSIQTGVPVMCFARSETRNRTSSATSELLPGCLPVSGISPSGYSTGTSAFSTFRELVLSEISVSIQPGQAALTRIWCLASSTASICAIVTWAALVQE